MPRRSLAARLFAALFGAVLALGVLEGALRVGAFAPEVRRESAGNVRDDFIKYRRRPGTAFRNRSPGEFDVLCKHNSLGFRDVEHEPTVPPGTFRIVALGDSFTYGTGAEYEDTYLARVERELNRRPGDHPRIEIVKLGLPRHFPHLERLTLEHVGLSFSPDLVMVAILPNDVIDTLEGVEAVCTSKAGFLVSCAALRWGEAVVRAYEQSAVARVLLTWWSRLIHPSETERDDAFRDGGPFEAAWLDLEAELGRMQTLARRGGAAFVLVSIPLQPPWSSAMNLYPQARLERWSRANEAELIPTLPALQAAPPDPPLYWETDGHATPAGYGVIADAIVAGLTERSLVP